MKKLALLAMLCLPLMGQVSIQNATLNNLSVAQQAAAGGPTCSGSISESFDTNPGYDLSWTEDDSGSLGVVDPDDTTRTETYFSAEDFYSENTGNEWATAWHAYTSVEPAYVAASVYIDAETLGDGNEITVLAFEDPPSDTTCVKLIQTSGSLYFSLEYSMGADCMEMGNGTSVDTYAMSIDNVYIIEMMVDEISTGASDSLGWRIWDCGSDGTGCSATPDYTDTTTSLDLSDGGMERVWIGCMHSSTGGIGCTGYTGLVEIGNSQPCS